MRLRRPRRLVRRLRRADRARRSAPRLVVRAGSDPVPAGGHRSPVQSRSSSSSGHGSLWESVRGAAAVRSVRRRDRHGGRGREQSWGASRFGEGGSRGEPAVPPCERVGRASPSGRAAYRRLSMREATWTIKPCDPRQAAALARELDVSETTASVLVRRGYADPAAARTFLAGEPPGHDPFLLGDMAAACERIRAAVSTRHADLRPRRLRRRRHLRDRARRPRAPRARRRRRLAPAQPLRGRLRRLERDARPAGRERVSASCSPSTAGSPRSTRSPRRKPRVSKSSSPTTIARATSFPTARSSRLDRRTTRSPSSAAPASSTSSPRRCSASGLEASPAKPATPGRETGSPSAPLATSGSPVTSTWSRSRRSPTSSRSSTRTGRLRSPACAVWQQPRDPACAR